MWVVERYDTYGVGRKSFENKEDAEKWLESDAVKEDKEYGMWFKLVEEK